MPPLNEARVPHIVQNDAGRRRPILCGPASIQAILYGIDNGRFEPPTSATLRPGVDVRADQTVIWDEVRRVSVGVAHDLGATPGGAGGALMCVPQPGGRPPFCWITHPNVMGKVIEAGLNTGGLHLDGVGTAAVQLVPEVDIPAALVDSISHGVGAALLVDSTHWVVVYRTVPLSGIDRAFFYHDPLTTAPTCWPHVMSLLAAVVDIDAVGVSESVVVGARSGTPFAAIMPPQAAPLQRDVAEPAFQDWQPQGFATTLGDSMQSLGYLSGQVDGGMRPTRVFRVRHARKAFANYHLVEFGSRATVALDARTHQPLLISCVSAKGQQIPRLLERDELATTIDGERVEVHGAPITLDKSRFHIDHDLVWDQCNESRSMLAPFYVIHQPRAGQHGSDTVYVRSVDGRLFARLTRTLRGA